MDSRFNFSSNSLFIIYKSLKNNQESQSNQKLSELSETKTFQLDLSLRLVRFSELLDNGISTMEFGYKGGPYEINLRDILFWCELLISPKTGFYFKFKGFMVNFDYFLLTLYECMKLVYYQRMRCEQDKLFIRNAFSSVFECDSDNLHSISEDVGIYWNCEKIYFNDKVLHREAEPLNFQKSVEHLPLLLGTQRETLKNLIECVHMEKPVLLCGSTDTGKTKIIGTLCCLSNQMYNSENIDDSVTGNFEQVIQLNIHK